MEAYGAGNLPVNNPDWIPFIRKTTQAGKSVFIISQSAQGSVDLELYLCGRKARDAGAIPLGDMTLETAIVKLMILQGNETDQREVENLMCRSLAGEIDDTKE